MTRHVFDPFKMGFGWTDEEDGGDGDGASSQGPLLQFVSFSVGGSTFAVDILSIREFKRWTETTGLPNTPVYVRGVINLRGVVVPVYDLRSRFGQGETEPTSTHVIMIVSVAAPVSPGEARLSTAERRAERTVGLLVDAVDDVLTVPADALASVPETDASAHPFVQGVLTVDERMIAVLDLDCLLSHEVVPGLPL